MKKNILTGRVADDIISRALQLEKTHKAQWGKMNATEMLLHCNRANTQLLTANQPYQPPTLKEYMVRFLALYVAPRFPKNRKGAAINDTLGAAHDVHFDEQKSEFVRIVFKLAQPGNQFRLLHPSFGYLTTKQWGRAAWLHLDHHLRQFGV